MELSSLRKWVGLGQFLPMGVVINMESIRAGLRKVMADKKAKPTTLSLAVGTNRTLVKDLLEKTGDVNLSTLTKLAEALGVEVIDLLTADGPSDPIPKPDELARMIERAMAELPLGVTFADYPRAVSTSLREQLEQYQASGGYQSTEGAETAPGTGVQPHQPTTQGGQEELRSQ